MFCRHLPQLIRNNEAVASFHIEKHINALQRGSHLIIAKIDHFITGGERF